MGRFGRILNEIDQAAEIRFEGSYGTHRGTWEDIIEEVQSCARKKH